MKKLLLLFLFLCVVNLKAQTPHQITFTDKDCIPKGSSTLTWEAVNKKLNAVFGDGSILDTFPMLGRADNIVLPFEIIIDGDITTISDYAFASCDKLTSVNMPKVTRIEINGFYDCTSLENMNVPAVTRVENSAFSNCTSLKSVDMPAATKIESYTFSNCTSLESADMPAAITIESGVFASCTSLKSVNIPAVTTIESVAFDNCTSLETITILNLTPPTLGDDVFGDPSNRYFLVPKSCTLRVADLSAADRYKKDKGWKSQFLPRKILPVSP